MEIITAVLTLFLVFLPTVYFLKWYIEWKKVANIVNKLPGPKTYPLVGTALDLFGVSRDDLFDFFCSRLTEFGPIFRTWMGPIPEVHLMKPADIEVVLSSQKLLDKAGVYNFLHPWLGKGLLTNTGASWHSRRKLITPTFHFSILENFVNTFVEKSDILVNQRLDKLADGREFNICPEITRCALDIICKTAMGVDVNAMLDSKNEYVSAVYEMSEITANRMRSLWYYPDLVFFNVKEGKRYKKCLEILHGFTNKIIEERKQEIRNRQQNIAVNTNEDEFFGKKKRMAFLDMILESAMKGAQLSDTDIREEVDTFMFEGHDTTTSSICFTLFMLGNNLDIQEKVAEELKNIFGDDDRPITLKDISEMKYLERVIKESLRLYPSVPVILRKTRETVQIAGYDIPPGTTLAVHIIQMHRDAELYPDPLKFDPDRFLPEACKGRHPFSYVPFSAGPRNCIGQKFALLEEKTVLASILRKFKVRATETPDKMKFHSELILRWQKGVNLTMTRR